MPPKKGSTKATASAKATPSSTAATERPRRATVTAPEAAPEPVPASKKRGRPAKSTAEAEEPPKKRGRPTKATATKNAKEEASAQAEKAAETTADAPKKRGKATSTTTTKKTSTATAKPQPKATSKATKKSAVAKDESAPPRKRGRPPKGGETTKIGEDDPAAAQQLETELQETADAAQEEKSKPSTTSKTAMTNNKSAQKPATSTPTTTGQQYWLMKAEQEDREEKAHDGTVINTKFTIDDLRAKTEPELWDGVRNVVAASNMRAMKKGDLAFFYASGGKQGRTPGIVGIMEIVSEAQPDVTTADPSCYGYVEDENARNKWVVVGVEFRKKLSRPVSLKELQKFKGPGGVLENMQLHKLARLSVSKVTEKEWSFIVNELIEGYEDEDVA